MAPRGPRVAQSVVGDVECLERDPLVALQRARDGGGTGDADAVAREVDRREALLAPRLTRKIT